MKVVGVTACPSGVAHTYMTAEALVIAGENMEWMLRLKHKGVPE